MIYRKFKEKSLSLLGMGCMRLPERTEGVVDEDRAQEIINLAYENGINYYDTAYVYHGGESERFLGRAMKRFKRESFSLANKFPGFIPDACKDPEGIFEEQLERCQTEYFDFYLLHNLNEEVIREYLDPSKGIIRYFEQQQKAGRIKYLGFSSHAKNDTLQRFASYRKWDFAQIQLNYLDWELQDAKTQYEILTRYELPVIVMEPVRGGKLAELNAPASAVLKRAAPDKSVASWAFRWLMDLANVPVILSGMTTLDQLNDNLGTFAEESPLSDGEKQILNHAKALFEGALTIPCTACRYCCDCCPKKLDIPDLMNLYNNYSVNYDPALMQRFDAVGAGESTPESCIGCGDCAKHCPQSIRIPEIMRKLANVILGQKES